MANRFARMRQDKKIVGACDLGKWLEAPRLAQAIALAVRHQLTNTRHARTRAPLHLSDCPSPRQWLRRRQSDNAPGVSPHRLDHIAIAVLDQPWIAPAERESHGAVNAISIHRCYQVVRVSHFGAGVTIKL